MQHKLLAIKENLSFHFKYEVFCENQWKRDTPKVSCVSLDERDKGQNFGSESDLFKILNSRILFDDTDDILSVVCPAGWG